jgi:hypothetical protein
VNERGREGRRGGGWLLRKREEKTERSRGVPPNSEFTEREDG